MKSYHPKANGQVEKTNRILCKIITKTPLLIGMLDIYNALWANKVTTKSMLSN